MFWLHSDQTQKVLGGGGVNSAKQKRSRAKVMSGPVGATSCNVGLKAGSGQGIQETLEVNRLDPSQLGSFVGGFVCGSFTEKTPGHSNTVLPAG